MHYGGVGLSPQPLRNESRSNGIPVLKGHLVTGMVFHWVRIAEYLCRDARFFGSDVLLSSLAMQ